MNLFVVSDIHGMYKHFEKLITFWDKKSTFVILGDLVDRGPDSYRVIRHVMELKKTYGKQVIFCKGNHEEMLLDYITSPEIKYSFYYKYGGRETIASFLAQLPEEVTLLHPIEQAYRIKEAFQQELAFLANGKRYAIVGNVLLTHAGFDSTFAELEMTADDMFLWTRKHYLTKNRTSYINVFGHTPLPIIHESSAVWQSEDKKYIGIDGGCYYTGQLNAVLLSEQGELLQTYEVNEPI